MCVGIDEVIAGGECVPISVGLLGRVSEFFLGLLLLLLVWLAFRFAVCSAFVFDGFDDLLLGPFVTNGDEIVFKPRLMKEFLSDDDFSETNVCK